MTKLFIKQFGIVFSEKTIADIMVNNAKKEILSLISKKQIIRILEPSVGDGSLIIRLLEDIPDHVEVFVDCLDVHEKFLVTTQQKFVTRSNIHIMFIHKDYIDFIPEKLYDIIISNPPYVRTSTIGNNKSQLLKSQFGLSGKIDLYHAFFAKMLTELSSDGIIIIITSNKYLYNKTGNSLKEKILLNLYINLIIDLGDTKLFDAAVLPAILIGTKNKDFHNHSKFIGIYENYSMVDSSQYQQYQTINEAIFSNDKNFIFENKIFEVKKGDLTFEDNSFHLIEHEDKKFVKKVQKASKYILKNIAEVKVGIKTTADKVFLLKEKPLFIENELVHKIIVSKSINKWLINKEKLKYIIYPYDYQSEQKKVISLERYPLCKNYFEQESNILKARTYIIESNREWYEIWVPHYPKIWKQEKIVFKDISSDGIFAYDKDSIVNGDSYFIVLKNGVNPEYIYLILGVLNSNILMKYHDIMFPNKLYSNKKRFNSQSVEKYPIPSIESIEAQKIIQEVKKLIFNKESNIKMAENEINLLCHKVYNLSKNDFGKGN